MVITLLEGTTYNWFAVQGNMEQWTRLRSKLFAYFKPADYLFKTRQALSFWV